MHLDLINDSSMVSIGSIFVRCGELSTTVETLVSLFRMPLKEIQNLLVEPSGLRVKKTMDLTASAYDNEW